MPLPPRSPSSIRYHSTHVPRLRESPHIERTETPPEHAGVQQILLASRAEVGLETLRKLERGEVVGMKLETIMRIAAALEVTPPDLIPALGMVSGVEDLPARRRRSAD